MRQIARQQAKVYEKALAGWFGAQSSLKAANDIWVANDTTGDGYIDDAVFTNLLTPFLDTQSGSGYTSQTSNGRLLVSTPEMQQVRTLDGTTAASRFISDGGIPAEVNYTHLRLFWQPTDATHQRQNFSPQIYFFLPTLPN